MTCSLCNSYLYHGKNYCFDFILLSRLSHSSIFCTVTSNGFLRALASCQQILTQGVAISHTTRLTHVLPRLPQGNCVVWIHVHTSTYVTVFWKINLTITNTEIHILHVVTLMHYPEIPST